MSILLLLRRGSRGVRGLRGILSFSHSVYSIPSSVLRSRKETVKKKEEKKTYETITPGCFCPIESSRIKPNCINLFPEHRFGSQWPKSQQAALNGGLEEVEDSLSPRGTGRARGRGLGFLPPREKLSFLWRTMLSICCCSCCIEM